MMPDLSEAYGRAAYEAAARASGCDQPWEDANQAKWIAAALAVLQLAFPMESAPKNAGPLLLWDENTREWQEGNWLMQLQVWVGRDGEITPLYWRPLGWPVDARRD